MRINGDVLKHLAKRGYRVADVQRPSGPGHAWFNLPDGTLGYFHARDLLAEEMKADREIGSEIGSR